jgi:nitric oxide reductase NorQ protein
MTTTATGARAVELEPGPSFVQTDATNAILERALAYAACGYAVNFSGPAGAGKTTLALHAASRIGRPVLLLAGDELITSTTLVGGLRGVRHRRIDDQFIRSVHKTQEDYLELWVDNRLTVACQEGYTLVYDEFTRSRPEANNLLLSVLEERILHMPVERGADHVLRVHPEFRLILTSNPSEYAGVFQAPDALKDRMITIHLERYDFATEVEIVRSRSGVDRADAETVVRLVRGMAEDRRLGLHPSMRAAIMFARVLRHLDARPDVQDPRTLDVLCDVLGVDPARRRAARERAEAVLTGEVPSRGNRPRRRAATPPASDLGA